MPSTVPRLVASRIVPVTKLVLPAMQLRHASQRLSSSTSLLRMATHSVDAAFHPVLTARAKPAFSCIAMTRQPRARARSAAPSVEALSTTMVSANGMVWRAMVSSSDARRSARL